MPSDRPLLTPKETHSELGSAPRVRVARNSPTHRSTDAGDIVSARVGSNEARSARVKRHPATATTTTTRHRVATSGSPNLEILPLVPDSGVRNTAGPHLVARRRTDPSRHGRRHPRRPRRARRAPLEPSRRPAGARRDLPTPRARARPRPRHLLASPRVRPGIASAGPRRPARTALSPRPPESSARPRPASRAACRLSLDSADDATASARARHPSSAFGGD